MTRTDFNSYFSFETHKVYFSDDKATLFFSMIWTGFDWLQAYAEIEHEFDIDDLEVYAQDVYLPKLSYHQTFDDDETLNYPMVQTGSYWENPLTVDDWLEKTTRGVRLDFIDSFLAHNKAKIIYQCKDLWISEKRLFKSVHPVKSIAA